ncbi:DUF2190 family protein [Nesterenkonia jeotgali]|uniref:DUF2190 family protein n=1 Tax=Nesterenkonia jeotgali TaxID=317018 RepID=A0A0W8IG68_9MICC|nr:DUF2190 family protein [Nesterenkonia jeotgali]KUG58975.1 hypothetical protein AVL63_02840 [Nesterenkonia jeotgali]
MATNQRYARGEYIALTADKAYASGDPVVIGAVAGVAKIAAAEGEKVTIWLVGSYDFTVTGAAAQGEIVYLGGSGLTMTANSTPFGVALGSKGSGSGDLEVAPYGYVTPAAAPAAN